MKVGNVDFKAAFKELPDTLLKRVAFDSCPVRAHAPASTAVRILSRTSHRSIFCLVETSIYDKERPELERASTLIFRYSLSFNDYLLKSRVGGM
jgi:hypothetical protein